LPNGTQGHRLARFRHGLATAFNGPIAGGIFVLEELVRRFDTRIAIATFGVSAGAIAVERLFLGNTPDFHVEAFALPRLWHCACSFNLQYPRWLFWSRLQLHSPGQPFSV
jgi:hypothetical protein